MVARWAPLTLLLSAMAPIGAYELLALYGIQAAVVVGSISLVSFVKCRRPAPSGRVPLFARPRFSLRDVLKAILLTGAVLAIIRFAAQGTTGTLGGMAWWPWVVAGVARAP